MNILVRNVTLAREQQVTDLRVRGGKIVELAPTLAATPEERVVQGQRGRLVPALADDHLHIGAWLRSMRSRPFPPSGLSPDACRLIERDGPGAAGWSVLFGIDHQHDAGHELELLDRHVTHPVLLVHRTGHGAFANRLGQAWLMRAGLQTSQVGACWRACLGPVTPTEEAALLGRLRDSLLAAGVADIRDATPCPASMADRAARIAQALWPVRVSFMGLPGDPLAQATHLKLFELAVPDHADRPLAVHAVEPYEIHWACQVVGAAGRIEHASICPEPLVEMVAATGCTVCANPGFFVDRPAALVPMLESGEAEFFQPLAELRDAGVRLSFGSDAPVGRPGPWSAIRGAQRRGQGAMRFPGAGLSFDDALRCAVGLPDLVDAPARDWLGQSADFAVLFHHPDAFEYDAPVGATVIAGRLAFDISGGIHAHV